MSRPTTAVVAVPSQRVTTHIERGYSSTYAALLYITYDSLHMIHNKMLNVSYILPISRNKHSSTAVTTTATITTEFSCALLALRCSSNNNSTETNETIDERPSPLGFFF